MSNRVGSLTHQPRKGLLTEQGPKVPRMREEPTESSDGKSKKRKMKTGAVLHGDTMNLTTNPIFR